MVNTARDFVRLALRKMSNPHRSLAHKCIYIENCSQRPPLGSAHTERTTVHTRTVT